MGRGPLLLSMWANVGSRIGGDQDPAGEAVSDSSV